MRRRDQTDVVLLEESLDQKVLKEAVSFISHADVLIVGGTSLVVYPAAGLIDYYRSDKLVLINRRLRRGIRQRIWSLQAA